MARVSIDGSSTSSSGKAPADAGAKGGSGHSGTGKARGSNIDQAAMIKVGASIAVILLAAVWILYSQGVFDAATRGEPTPPTPEAQAEFEKLEKEQIEAERQIERQGGVPPSRLGSG